MASFDSVADVARSLETAGYVAGTGLSTSLFLALKMARPLFLEGEPGVGKTEIAKVLHRLLETELIRLQCYEGLDLQQAVYEWNYPRQLLAIQAARAGDRDGEVDGEIDVFRDEFLLKRPLLRAIDPGHEVAPVLLIDELDRADEEFESFLLEILSDFQITIPELGTVRARHRPVVVITSNRTREIHDALKRRCVYHWIDYPTPEKELAIVRRRLPGISERLGAQVVAFVQAVRGQDLYKLPGISETLDWAEALGHLETRELGPEVVDRTLGFLLKYQDDVDTLRGPVVEELVQRLQSSGSPL